MLLISQRLQRSGSRQLFEKPNMQERRQCRFPPFLRRSSQHSSPEPWTTEVYVAMSDSMPLHPSWRSQASATHGGSLRACA